jgi:hypothetical protein
MTARGSRFRYLHKPSILEGDDFGLLCEGGGAGCGLIRGRGGGLGFDVEVQLGLQLTQLVLDDALVVAAVVRVGRLELSKERT